LERAQVESSKDPEKGNSRFKFNVKEEIKGMRGISTKNHDKQHSVRACDPRHPE
jgi:hypothetical protein